VKARKLSRSDNRIGSASSLERVGCDSEQQDKRERRVGQDLAQERPVSVELFLRATEAVHPHRPLIADQRALDSRQQPQRT
jgi:hypothetical protein